MAEALATVAPDRPDLLKAAADAFMKALVKPGIDGLNVVGLAKALAAVAADDPERLEQAAVIFAEQLDGSDTYRVAGMARAVGFVAKGNAGRLRQAAKACEEKLSGHQVLEPWDFLYLAEAIAAVAVGHEQLLIETANACMQRIAERGRNGSLVAFLAQVVVDVAAGGPEDFRYVVSEAFTNKLVEEPGLERWIVIRFAEALYVLARGDQQTMAKAAKAILRVDDVVTPIHHRAMALRTWTNQVVVRGHKAKLIEWREQMRWDQALGWSDQAELVQVHQIDGEEESPPETLETNQADSNCPAFLLAPREVLVPGLDSRLLAAVHANAKEKYELLRDFLITTGGGGPNVPPPWTKADDTIKDAVNLTWHLAAEKLAMNWTEDANRCELSYMLFKIMAEPDVLATIWKERQATAVGQSNAPAKILATKSKTNKHLHGQMRTGEILELIRHIAKKSNYDPGTLQTILDWTKSNSTDAMKAIIKIANDVSPGQPEIETEQKSSGGRHFVDSNELIMRLNCDNARRALASRATEWEKRHVQHPYSVSDEDFKNKVSICPGCGCVDRLVRPNKRGEPSVKSPCICCKTEVTEKAIALSPVFYQICNIQGCAANKSHVKFALPAPEKGWANSRRKKGLCPQCNAPLDRAEISKRTNA